MNKLSNITKSEHYFYTIDGNVLKTTHDLFSYLDNCDQISFEHHVNSKKNDFKEWIKTTLLFPELAEAFAQAKTSSDCKKALIEFFSVFENQQGGIAIEDFFHTNDGYILKTTHELYYYLNNCSDDEYLHHANSQRNDFAQWVRNILKYPQLADELLKVGNRQQAADIVRDFVTNSPFYRGGVSAYGEYLKKLRKEQIHLADIDPKVKALKEFSEYTEEAPKQSLDSEIKTFMPVAEDQKNEINKKNVIEETMQVDAVKINLPEEAEPKESPKPVFDKEGLIQFTDEDLEKYVKFSKREKIDTSDDKVDYLKNALQELRNLMKELWKIGKDPMVAELMARVLDSKIEFYALSKNVEDYNKIIQKMKEIQNELIICQEQANTNFADEIMKDLKLESVAMKKEI
jgi:hypothetical protein